MTIRRRDFIGGALGASALTALPLFRSGALAAAENDKIVAAAKHIGPTKLSAMMWAPYYNAGKPPTEEFRAATGITIGSIKDLSIFDIPQATMAEALVRSPEYDLFHVDAGMIPSLVSAGLLEPLDAYMKKAEFKIDAWGTIAQQASYKGQTYGIPTDGNCMLHMVRKDLMDDPEKRKRFEDQHGKPLAFPQTWDDDFQLMKFFHDPANNLWGSGNLRNRANGYTWYLTMFYSFGGFPFAEDGTPTLNTEAGQKALAAYLREKEVAHPEATGWGTVQMIPRLTNGNVFSATYWSGVVKLDENSEKSKTAGKWLYGTIPGAEIGLGKVRHRAVASPMCVLLVNKYSPRKEAAAYLSLWWGTMTASTQMVSDKVFALNDPWHKAHMTTPTIVKAYTPEGLAGMGRNMQVACPQIYMTGSLEFQDLLGKNLSEAYLGQLKPEQALKKTEEEWGLVVKRIGAAKVKEDLKSYRDVMPKIDAPA